jgi:hypothetical protein
MSRSPAEILKDTLSNLQEIVRLEVSLAKAEVRNEVAQIRTAAVFMGVGVLALVLATTFGLVALMYLLARVMPGWTAAIVVAFLLFAVAGVFIAIGAKRFRSLPGSPLTVESLKEDMRWAKHPHR